MFIQPSSREGRENFSNSTKILSGSVPLKSNHSTNIRNSNKIKAISQIPKKSVYKVKSPLSLFDFIQMANLFGSYSPKENKLITQTLDDGIAQLSVKMNDLYNLKLNLENKFQAPMKIGLINKTNNHIEVKDLDVFDVFMKNFPHKKPLLNMGYNPEYSQLPWINIDNQKAKKLLNSVKNNENFKNDEQKLESHIYNLILSFHNLQESILENSSGNPETELIIAPVTQYTKGPIFHLESAINIWDIYNNENLDSKQFLKNHEDEISLKVENFKKIKEHNHKNNSNLLNSLRSRLEKNF